MSDFPRKILPAPIEESPVGDIYKRLKEENEKFPIRLIGNEKTWLPDFSRAIKMQHCIYRVNVPGYFFRCPGSYGNGYLNSTTKSGLIISKYNYSMNSIHTPSSKLFYSGTTLGIVIHNTTFVEANYSAYKTIYKGLINAGYYTPLLQWNGSDQKSDFASITNGSTVSFMPSTTIGGNACFAAIPANQRTYPKKFYDGSEMSRNYGLDYFVSTGSNDCGGIANNMIPIIPGLATTTKPSGTYQDGSAYNPNYCVSCGSEDNYTATWNCNALSESTDAEVFTVGYYEAKSKYYCIRTVQNGYEDATYVAVHNAVLEARGTYVYYYRDAFDSGDSTTDEFYFIPAVSSPKNVKPLTKIRSIENPYSCTYQIPEVQTPLTSQSSGEPYVNTSIPYVRHGYASAGLTNIANRQIKRPSDWSSSMMNDPISIDDSKFGWCCGASGPRLYVNPNANAMSTDFLEIFKNASVNGLSEKFVAQQLGSVKEYPGTATASVSDITNGGATHKVFDPTTDGE